MTLSPAEHAAMAAADLFVCFVNPAWFMDARVQAQAAYAHRCGKPFRVLGWPGVRLPEDAFAGVQDLEIVRYTDTAQMQAQIRCWLDAYVVAQ